MIISLVVLVVIVALSIPSAVIFIPLAVITGNVEPLYAVACFIVRAGFCVAGIRVQVHGRELVPAGRACIFMANHVSNLDPPALISHIPGRTAAFSKRSVFKLPVFGFALKLGEFIPVDRTGNKAAAQASVCRGRARAGQGPAHHHLCRGHALADGRMQPFKKGSGCHGHAGNGLHHYSRSTEELQPRG